MSLGKLIVASSTLALIAACGAATDPASYVSGDASTITQGAGPADDAGADGSRHDAGKKDDGGDMSCGACVTDSDCQKSCKPPAGGGTHCCDLASGVCYGVTLNHCPSPVDAGAE